MGLCSDRVGEIRQYMAVRAGEHHEMRIEAILSETGVVDSDGDIILAGAFDDQLELSNLQMRLMHRRGDIIGCWNNLRIDGSLLKADGELFGEDYDLAKMGETLIRKEMMKGVSIGFRPVAWTNVSTKERPWGWDTSKLELREASIVDIPSNASAEVTEIKRKLKDGEASEPTVIHKFFKAEIRVIEDQAGSPEPEKYAGVLAKINELSNSI